MQALLVTGGGAPPRARLASRFSSFDLVCAADSGLEVLAAWGLKPGIIVGDMDSLSDTALIARFPEAEVLRARRDKDETDTELGLSALAARGAERIVLAGGGGGRLDHLLAIRCVFERKDWGSKRPAEWHTASEAVYLVGEGRSLTLEVEAGTVVSVFPLAGGASGMSSEGLDWPLSGLDWGPGDCGVSNIARSGTFSVRAGRGELLLVVELVSA
jgi:thiamine pyrophosphokinase